MSRRRKKNRRRKAEEASTSAKAPPAAPEHSRARKNEGAKPLRKSLGAFAVVLEKLPAIYADPISLAEIPDLPRRELVTRDEGTTVTGLVFGTLMSLAALGAALPVVASGGALAAVLAATAAGGAAGAGIARVVRKVILGGVGAEALEREILEAQERILGPDHRVTLTTKANLASTLRSRGDPERLETFARNCLPPLRRVSDAQPV